MHNNMFNFAGLGVIIITFILAPLFFFVFDFDSKDADVFAFLSLCVFSTCLLIGLLQDSSEKNKSDQNVSTSSFPNVASPHSADNYLLKHLGGTVFILAGVFFIGLFVFQVYKVFTGPYGFFLPFIIFGAPFILFATILLLVLHKKGK